MKIIKEGQDPKKTEIEETCHKCSTVFSYTQSDVQPDSRDGDYVICPVCGGFISAKKLLTPII